MARRSKSLVLPVFCGGCFLLAGFATPEMDGERSLPGTMGQAAKVFLASLEEDQRARCVFPFDHGERQAWSYLPGDRRGLWMGDLSLAQRQNLLSLMRAALSRSGFHKAEGVFVLESVLRELQPSAGRDPGKYAFTLFGTPDRGAWGWGLEGHHLSLNFTTGPKQGQSSTPLFFGVAPARVAKGPHEGLRVLGAEVDLARALFHSLHPSQQEQAKLPGSRPRDVVLGPNVAKLPAPAGLPTSELEPNQRQALFRLLGEYTGNLPPREAKKEQARIQKLDPGEIRFAWLGDWKEGPLYYRVMGSDFAIEYASIANDANHAHSVWRDLERDFGAELLEDHPQAGG